MAGETQDATYEKLDNEELQAIKEAMERHDWDTARALSTNYVNDHPDEFADYRRKAQKAGSQKAALNEIVTIISGLRTAGLTEHLIRAEAWQLHRWEPQDITGSSAPRLRNPDEHVQPKLRNHK